MEMTMTTGTTSTLTPKTNKPWMQDVLDYVFANFAEDVTLDDLAIAAGLSKFNFCRTFHRDLGIPPMKWLWMFRSLLAAELLKNTSHWSLTDVATTCGFTSCAHFSRLFKTHMGATPSKFRSTQQCGEQARGLLIDIQDRQHPLLKTVALQMSAYVN